MSIEAAATFALPTLRIDVVGSLLRPEWLKEAAGRRDRGELSALELQEAQDRAIRDAIARQEAIGLPVVTDGEFRRLNFQDSFSASVSGFAATQTTMEFVEGRNRGGHPLQRWDPGYAGPGPAVQHRLPVTERIRMTRNLPLQEYQFASSVATVPVKVTLIGPDRILQRFAWEESTEVYADPDAFASDLVAVEQQIIGQVINAGCRYVQIDAPSYTAYVDTRAIEEMRGRGEDPEANMARGMSADNAVIDAFPDVTFGIHLCRGNQRSMWHREGHYDAIAERLFNTLHHQRFLLEYDSDRAGSFAPLRFMPRGKIAVLGLVSTKVPELESADFIKRRIDEASKYLPLDQLALSPQCGFASDVTGNLLSEEDQWRKLARIVEVMHDVWR